MDLDLARVLHECVDELYLIDARTGRLLYANRKALENTGYTLEELQAITPLDLQRGVSVQELLERSEPLKSGELTVIEFETDYHRRDGSVYRVEHRVHLVPAHDPPVLVVRAREIEERKPEPTPADLYRRMVEEADEGIWVIDGENNTTYANEAIAKMLGYTREEMLGMSVFSFMDEEGSKIAKVNLERRRHGVHQQLEFKYVRKNGGELWTIIASHPLFDAKGAYSGAYAIVTDITERKERESRLLESLHLAHDEREGALSSVGGTALATWMPSVAGLRSTLMAKRFALLADPRRLELIELLASGEERSVTALATALRMSQSNVSKHLRVLWEAGLLKRRPSGTQMFYSLADPTVAILCRIVCHWLGNRAHAEFRALAG